ncbi:MAG: hypothetical protein ACJAWS_000237 [Oleiphilaceae bacterium]|jgi:hypothetical protein
MEQSAKAVSGYVDDTAEITESSIADIKPVERRIYTRRAARWSCTITTNDKTRIDCSSLDVSERGASVLSPVNFKANAIFVFELNVRYKGLHKNLRMLSEVKRTSISNDGFTLGLYFKDANEQVFDFLSKYANKKI